MFDQLGDTVRQLIQSPSPQAGAGSPGRPHPLSPKTEQMEFDEAYEAARSSERAEDRMRKRMKDQLRKDEAEARKYAAPRPGPRISPSDHSKMASGQYHKEAAIRAKRINEKLRTGDHTWFPTSQFGHGPESSTSLNSREGALRAWELEQKGRRVKSWDDVYAAEDWWSQTHGKDSESGKAWRTPWADIYRRLRNEGLSGSDQTLNDMAFKEWASQNAPDPFQRDVWLSHYRAGQFSRPTHTLNNDQAPWRNAVLPKLPTPGQAQPLY